MIVTATIAVGLKLIVESKKKKITFWAAFISWWGAVCISYLFYPVITKHSSEELVPLLLAFVVLVGDKLTSYFVDKFQVDTFLTAIMNMLGSYIKKIIS